MTAMELSSVVTPTLFYGFVQKGITAYDPLLELQLYLLCKSHLGLREGVSQCTVQI